MARQVSRNDRKLRGRQVRLITEDNENIGIVSFEEAIDRAEQAGEDLVEVASNANPTVCRIMDYGKYQYEESKKRRESRKKQHNTKLKEIQFHPRIEEHDYETKRNRAIDFLKKGHKVKFVMVFRGREMAHQELGRAVLDRVVNECSEYGKLDAPPKRTGRLILAFMAPTAGKG